MKEIILCVDDEKIVLDSLKAQLKQFFNSEFIIEIAESGEEALEILQEYEEEEGLLPALVISDMIMPNMKGSELLEKIHVKYPECKKILLTGQAENSDIIRTIAKVRLYRYFPKPWDQMDLNITVKEAVRSFTQAKEIKDQRDQLLELNTLLEQKVEDRTKELLVKNEMVMDSINYAKIIQDGALVDLEEVKEYLNFFVFFKPLQVVSGDCYFFSKVYKKTIICVVDCTGHGVPGALMSMIALNELNRIVNVQKVTDPSTILEEFHLGVVKALNQEVNEIEDGMDVSICVHDNDAQQLIFSGAKRPMAYVQNGEMNYVKGASLPIGGLTGYKRRYCNHVIPISTETTIYLFTDGFVDQHGGEDNTRFKIKTFRDLIFKNCDLPLSEQKNKLELAMLDWQGECPQTDDILVVGFKLNPTESQCGESLLIE